MIGISTTFFALQGFGIYDSVAKAKELGFNLVELGAAHKFENNIQKTLKKIKKDFPETRFTLHGLFPPFKKKFWFNTAEGLTAANKRILENFFSTAQNIEAELVSFHSGFRNKVFWSVPKNGLTFARYGKKYPWHQALEKAFSVFSFAQKLSEETGIGFAIENQPNTKQERPLFYSAKHFGEIFESFPNAGFLFDFGHALFSENLQEMLLLKNRIKQLHLHYSKAFGKNNEADNHLPLTEIEQFEPLSAIKQLKRIPLVFEHGSNVSCEVILKEKQLLELFLKEN